MDVRYLPDTPHVLRLLAETQADVDTIGTLVNFGPLRRARRIYHRQPAPRKGLLIVGAEWDTRQAFDGLPMPGAGNDRLWRQVGRQLGSSLSELFRLTAREMQDHGSAAPDAASPDAQEKPAVILEEFELVKETRVVHVGSPQGRVDEVQGAHSTSFVPGGQ